jgi:uncharacterized protein (DUF2267 family)
METVINESGLIEEVRRRMGGGTDDDARRAVCATLVALAETMERDDLAAVASALPPSLRAVVEESAMDATYDLPAFCARVASIEGVQYGHAFEHAQAVVRAISLHLDEQRRRQLNSHLWPELTRTSVADRPERHVVPPRGRTLAGARPGSQHPISEATPTEHVQEHSVVHENNPHGSRKLSSGSR